MGTSSWDPEYRNEYRVEDIPADQAWGEEILEERRLVDIKMDVEKKYLDACIDLAHLEDNPLQSKDKNDSSIKKGKSTPKTGNKSQEKPAESLGRKGKKRK